MAGTHTRVIDPPFTQSLRCRSARGNTSATPLPLLYVPRFACPMQRLIVHWSQVLVPAIEVCDSPILELIHAREVC
ncbi:hypothetical protein EmuJ_000891300 [Echinococcus multilocularis]|uniref:Uncharacterized protein n=1 Tax=Echinococcus multilocularis TaxID=6211 RepID=A0A068YD95_ECHMU|nr:hypothetical protein EmuJ_000891300 [Echinococcus multilocularis]